MATKQEIKDNDKLKHKPIRFPDVESFAELFTDPKPAIAKGETSELASLEAWECGTWSDKGRGTRCHITGYMRVNDRTGDFGSMYVGGLTDRLWEFIKGGNVLLGSRDSLYFEIVEREGGRGLVILQHNLIIGSHWLAVIDFTTVPNIYKGE